MFKLSNMIETDLDSIEYYYECQNKIKELSAKINDYNVKIEEIKNRISRLNNQLDKELNGKYQEMIEFGMKDGKPVSRIVNKKVESGRLEKLTKFLNEDSLEKATKSYLKSMGAKIDRLGNLENPQIFYRGKDEFNPYVVSLKED